MHVNLCTSSPLEERTSSSGRQSIPNCHSRGPLKLFPKNTSSRHKTTNSIVSVATLSMRNCCQFAIQPYQVIQGVACRTVAHLWLFLKKYPASPLSYCLCPLQTRRYAWQGLGGVPTLTSIKSRSVLTEAAANWFFWKEVVETCGDMYCMVHTVVVTYIHIRNHDEIDVDSTSHVHTTVTLICSGQQHRAR
jgi:hypothetical protein